MPDRSDRYTLLNTLQFQLGLAQRYAIIVEHRLGNGIETPPYENLLATAMTDATEAYAQLVEVLALPNPIELTRQDLQEIMNHGA